MNTTKTKLRRKLGHELNKLFSVKSFEAVKDPKEYMRLGTKLLARMVHLNNGEALILSEHGYAKIRTISAIVDDLDLFSGLADYSDISSAIDRVFAELTSVGQVPDDAEEFIAIVRGKVEALIDEHAFAYPLHGVALEDGTDELGFGNFTICRPTSECLNRLGMRCDSEIVANAISSIKYGLLLVGRENGTIKIARERFKYRAKLFSGMLAVVAAANYEQGARAFRIGIVTSPETAYGTSTSFHWGKKSGSPGLMHNFVSKQELTLSPSFMEDSGLGSVVDDFLNILSDRETTEIQKAIINSVYWFSDAHLDSVVVMQFVKYFSCIESFFSSEREHITQRISQGAAAVLAYGGLNEIKNSEYLYVKRKMLKNYEHRSTAVHDGLHNHVSEDDTAKLSQWAAWIVLTLLMASKQGLKSLEQLKTIVEAVELAGKPQ